MELTRILFLVIIVLTTQTLYAARQSFFVAPAATDPKIDRHLQNHYVAIDPAIPAKDLLYVFLPGTDGTPFFYRQITNNAADNGFHAIGLNYVNDDAVNMVCGLGNTDLDCYSKVRLEVIDGTDRTPLVDVNRPNSIENRLIKLLAHLQDTRPSENWSQFRNSDGSIDWSKIIIAGHSQGGGHAGIIGRFHLVRRVLMFAAADFNGALQRPANWIAIPESTPNASPADRFRAFSHQQDEQVRYTNQINHIWPAFLMPRFGPSVSVDGISAPFLETHTLTSNRTCENAHGCVAADPRLVFEDGVPVYKPVWEYMLMNAESPLSVSEVVVIRNQAEVGRPHVGSSTKRYSIVLKGLGLSGVSEVLVNGRNAAILGTGENEVEFILPGGKVGAVGSSVIKAKTPEGTKSNAIRF